MGRTVAELLKTISSRELAEWMAFERTYGPVGTEKRLDVAAAQIQSTLVRINWTDRQKKPPRLEDYLPDWSADPQRRVEQFGDDGE